MKRIVDRSSAHRIRADKSKERDIHTMPNYGRKHDCTPECWCGPELVYTAPNGNRQYVHREAQ